MTATAIRAMGVEVVEAELMGKGWTGKEHRSKARHDPAAAIASVTMALAERGRARRTGVPAKRRPKRGSGIGPTGRGPIGMGQTGK